MSAVTDSDNQVYYDPENKPGISNLLTIYSSLKNIDIKETEAHFKDYNYGSLKKEIADTVVEKILQIQTKYNNLINSYGKEKTDTLIEELNLYKKSTGKEYEDDCATIILWIKRNEKNEKEKVKKFSNYKGREYPDGFFDDPIWYENGIE